MRCVRRSRVSRIRIDRRDIARGCLVGSAVLFYSRARRIASINFPSTAECRLSVSEFLPKLHTKFYQRVESRSLTIVLISRARIKYASVYTSVCIEIPRLTIIKTNNGKIFPVFERTEYILESRRKRDVIKIIATHMQLLATLFMAKTAS